MCAKPGLNVALKCGTPYVILPMKYVAEFMWHSNLTAPIKIKLLGNDCSIIENVRIHLNDSWLL